MLITSLTAMPPINISNRYEDIIRLSRLLSMEQDRNTYDLWLSFVIRRNEQRMKMEGQI